MCLIDFRLFYWGQGQPGMTGRDVPKSTFLSHRFSEGCFFIIASFLDHFLKVLSYLFDVFFEIFLKVYLIICSLAHDFHFLGERSPTRILLQDTYGLSTFTISEKTRKPFMSKIKNKLHSRIDFHDIS